MTHLEIGLSLVILIATVKVLMPTLREALLSVKAKLSKPKTNQIEERLEQMHADVKDCELYLMGLRDDLALVSSSQTSEIYVQSLATLSKGMSSILEKQDKFERQLITLVTALNKLTQQ